MEYVKQDSNPFSTLRTGLNIDKPKTFVLKEAGVYVIAPDG